jgi:hypothetical protein
VENLSGNYAFIDSQNLNLSIRSLGWILDFKKFRKYLKDKYSVSTAYLFIGYIEGNNDLYISLHKAVLIPNRLKFSALLKLKEFRPHLRYMNDLKDKLEYKKKRPHKDETL